MRTRIYNILASYYRLQKMGDYKQALDNVEEVLRRMQGSIYKFQRTASPDIFCSTLPGHWRSNKSLIQQFSVLILYPVADGTKVTVSAGNEENPCADIKNNQAEVQAQIARFSDLRFVGKSGRGKNFNLTITIHSKPLKEVAVVHGVIKVTVDGPRESRNSNKQFINDSRKRPNETFHQFIPPFLPLKQPRLMGSGMFPLLPASVAPTHLQALQAASSLPSHLTHLLSWPAIYKSYKTAIINNNGNVRLPSFTSPVDPMLMQQLSAILDFKNLTSNEDKLAANFMKPTTMKAKKPSPDDKASPKLPSSADMPSPCFSVIKNESTSSCDDDNLKKRLKPEKSDLNSPNETFSSFSSTSYLSRTEDDVPIDVETTTDDEEHTFEQRDASRSKNKQIFKPVIKLWRPYTPPISTDITSTRNLKVAPPTLVDGETSF